MEFKRTTSISRTKRFGVRLDESSRTLELVFKEGKCLRKHTHAEIMTVIDDAHSFGSSVQASTDTYSRH